jgi:nucleoside-triphosphatase THEP1
MSFKIKHGQLSAMNFQMAISKLGQAPLPAKSAYHVKRLIDGLSNASNRVRDLYRQDICKVHGIDDGKGGFVPDDEHGFKFAEGADKDAVVKAIQDFGNREIEVDKYKLTLGDLEKVEISAAELSHLDPVIFDEEGPIAVDNVQAIS